jgi:hypothetical protein
MDIPQVLVTAGVGVVASIVTALITHVLTRSQERRRYEREVTGKLAAMKSAERSETMIMAVQYGHSCFIVEGPEQTERDRVFLPMGSRITLGHASDNHIRLAHSSVSRIHAAFRAQDKAAYVEPLGAGSGIAVNGELVTSPKRLSVGDVITVPGAPYRITFVPLVT